MEYPLTDKDVLVGGCCYPHMDCVGSAYFIRDKIITTLKQFDEKTMSKFESSLQLLCLHRIDKKAVDGHAPAEHVAVTMSMNKWHLLIDVGKTVLSTLLAPGEETDSIPIIRNDIDAVPLKWKFMNSDGIINVKKSGSKTKYVFLPLHPQLSPFVTITHRNAVTDNHLHFLKRDISKVSLPHLTRIGTHYVGISGKISCDKISKNIILILPAHVSIPSVLESMAISAPQRNAMYSKYIFDLSRLVKDNIEDMISILLLVGIESEGWKEIFESLKSQ